MRGQFGRNKTAEKKLGDMLQDTVASVKRARSRNKSLREKWSKAVGEDISSHTEVKMVKKRGSLCRGGLSDVVTPCFYFQKRGTAGIHAE